MTNGMTNCFLDTNVLIYAAQAREIDERRTDLARALVLSTVFGVSGQTLAEFYSIAVRKAQIKLSREAADWWIDYLAAMPFCSVDKGIVRRGIMLSRDYGITYYDAALLAAAERLGAPIFYSEDLNHDQLYGSVRVINPFLDP